MGDEIPSPLDKFRIRTNYFKIQVNKVPTYPMKSDLARAICPQCDVEIKYMSSEKWRGTLKCVDCGARFIVE